MPKVNHIKWIMQHGNIGNPEARDSTSDAGPVGVIGPQSAPDLDGRHGSSCQQDAPRLRGRRGFPGSNGPSRLQGFMGPSGPQGPPGTSAHHMPHDIYTEDAETDYYDNE